MSAVDVIEEIKRLPREERLKILVFLAENQRELMGGEPAIHFVEDAAFEAAKKRVLKENAELLSRLAR